MNKAERTERIAMEAETVVVRFLEVEERNPGWFDGSTADNAKSPYSSDLLDGLGWAMSVLDMAIDNLPRGERRTALRDRFDNHYVPTSDRIYHA